VESLPSTGSGDSAAGSGMFGALALGAAAYLAAKKLREQGSELEPAED
jgi:LPXTG-motif cell wall-anchored protein